MFFAPIYCLGAGTFRLWICTIMSTIVMGYEGQVYFVVLDWMYLVNVFYGHVPSYPPGSLLS